jgi:hypothetical protein
MNYEMYELQMKREDRATISVSKKTHAEFERYRAILSAERGKVQTQEDVIKELLQGRLPAEHENEDDDCDDVYEDYVN